MKLLRSAAPRPRQCPSCYAEDCTRCFCSQERINSEWEKLSFFGQLLCRLGWLR
jgi:hypothetical protein